MKRSLVLLTGLLISAGALATAQARESGAVTPYPLNVCLVTGNELGSMGKPITRVHEGREIKLCCKPCIKKFEADPAKYLGKLR